MKLAFVDNLQVGGGLSRFSLLLCKSLVEKDPSLTLDYFIHADNLKRVPEIHTLKRVQVKILRSTRSPSRSVWIARKISRKLGIIPGQEDKLTKEITKRVNNEYDLAYFPSAHMMKRPDLSIPVVGTLHDFNWKYFFGQEIFGISFVEMMDTEITNWMNNGYNISSSHDVVNEAKKLYPSAKRYPIVVPIAPVVVDTEISDQHASALLKELGIDYPYILFPGNFYAHKNHLNLFTAFYLLKQKKRV